MCVQLRGQKHSVYFSYFEFVIYLNVSNNHTVFLRLNTTIYKPKFLPKFNAYNCRLKIIIISTERTW